MNGYRDEREALRARTEALENELEETRKQLEAARDSDTAKERLERIERVLDAAHDEVRSLRHGFGALRRPAPGRVFAYVAAGTALAAVFAVHRPRPTVGVQSRQPASVMLLGAAPAPAVEPAADEVDTTPPREVDVSWKASVKTATGIDLRAGTPCSVRGTIARSGLSNVQVLCGTRVLFGPRDEKRVQSDRAWKIWEELGATDAESYVYALDFGDTRAFGGVRSQVSIQTPARVATVWREGATAFKVELTIAEQSDAHEGDPIFEQTDRESTCPRFTTEATVVETAGDAQVPVGTTCDVTVRPHSSEQCRVRVKCGSSLLYGEGDGGYAYLAPTDDVLRIEDKEFSSDDGDPMLDLDPAAKRLVVWDEGVTSWKVGLKLARVAPAPGPARGGFASSDGSHKNP